jgi:DNA polymerase-4
MIIFLYVPGFYAAVEQADDPSLQGRPVIVGGNPRKRGSVTGVSIESRRFGVTEGSEVQEALSRCPDAVYRPTRLSRYREVSSEIVAVLRRTTDRLKSEDLGSFYLQCPEHSEPLSLAAELCVCIQAELTLQAVAGIGPTRFVAYLAARHHSFGEIRQILPDQVHAFLAEFPVTEIWGLGPATAEKLARHGITRIGDLQRLEPGELETLVDHNAPAFLALAKGEDQEPPWPIQRRRSLSHEKTLSEPCRDLNTLGMELTGLAGRLEIMLARERLVARTVTLGVDYIDGNRVTRTRTVGQPLARRNEITEIAVQLLTRTQVGVRHCRRLRLQVSRLTRAGSGPAPQQLSLF